MYILQPAIDSKSFEVDQKVIDASFALKGVCALTEVTEPIIVNCSSFCLSTFINLISHYNAITDEHDAEFEHQFFAGLNDGKLVGLVKEMCVLDSDFFLDSIADLILDRVKDMDWKEMQKYFQLDDDFSMSERIMMEENRFRFLISLDNVLGNFYFSAFRISTLHFPFPANTSFINLKNKFLTPMNALLARIVQRSNHKTAFNLSLINKSLKNENDRYPIKLSYFCGTGEEWQMDFCGIECSLSSDSYNNEYINAIKKRKIVAEKVDLRYTSLFSVHKNALRCNSMNFATPMKQDSVLSVTFESNKSCIYCFDLLECPFPSLQYTFDLDEFNFDEIYRQLIAKDFSKQISIRAEKEFGSEFIHLFKKENAFNFHKICLTSLTKNSAFNRFLQKYMDKDGMIICCSELCKIPDDFYRCSESDAEFDDCCRYRVDDILKFINSV